MNNGKVLKVRPGHDANCSSHAYIGYILITFVGYAALLGVLVVTQLAMRARRFADKPWLGKAKIGLWVIPHLLGIAAVLVLGYWSGAMDYGSSICVGALVVVMLVGMGVGWARIAAGAKPKQETEASEQPSPQLDMASLEARVAAGLCPRCGGHVAPTDMNCQWCGIDLARAREHLDELAGDEAS